MNAQAMAYLRSARAALLEARSEAQYQGRDADGYEIDALLEDVQTNLLELEVALRGRSIPRTQTRAASRSSRKPRKASAWNQFVASEMPKVLKKHPRFTPQRAMKEVSKRWRSSPKNPNRRRKR